MGQGVLVFVYFISTKRQSPADSDYQPIAYAVKAGGMRHTYTTAGPDGQPGLIVARAEVSASHLSSAGKAADWVPIVAGSVWCRCVGSGDPAEAMRPQSELLPGWQVELEDGHAWHVPRAVQWTASNQWGVALPCYDELIDGEWRPGSVVSRYSALWDSVVRVFDETTDQTERYKLETDTAVQALSVNYYIGPVECNVLRLLSRPARGRLFDALRDGPGLRSILQSMAAGDATTENIKKKSPLPDVAGVGQGTVAGVSA